MGMRKAGLVAGFLLAVLFLLRKRNRLSGCRLLWRGR